MEVRWFFIGRPSSDVEACFDNRHTVAEERRADLYLQLAGNDTVSLKLRGLGSGRGALEVKVRTAVPRSIRFGSEHQGMAAPWVKVSNAPQAMRTAVKAPQERWVRVAKARRTLKVSDHRGAISAVRPSSRVPDGCTFELTTIKVSDAEWWSIALEAFGQSRLLDQRLQRAGDWFLARSPLGLSLRVEASYAYPTWLARLSVR